jgi:hypothetical protein
MLDVTIRGQGEGRGIEVHDRGTMQANGKGTFNGLPLRACWLDLL